MQPEEIITYGSFVWEDMSEYRNIVTSKRWETTYTKEKSLDEPLPLNVFTRAIEQQFVKTANKDDLKSSTVGDTMNLVESHLPSQLKIVTSVAKRAI